MVKITFLAILLINIIFFFWQVRTGAPEIYLPPNYENDMASPRATHEIMLLSEVPELRSQNDTPIQPEESLPVNEMGELALLTEPTPPVSINNKILATLDHKKNSRNDFVGPLYKAENNLTDIQQNTASSLIPKYPIQACYQLQSDEYTQDMFAQENNKAGIKLTFSEQEKSHISSYLILTQKSRSYEQAKNNEQKIKQQGIKNSWLFRRGLFKWRISLGLFNSKERAYKAETLLSKQISQQLEVVPSYQTTLINSVKISAQDAQQITAFEQKFSMMIAQQVECEMVRL